MSRDEVIQELKRRKEGKRGSASSILTFVNQIRKKDIVVANDGLSGIVGIGIVKSDYLMPFHSRNPNRSLDYHQHVRLIDWQITKSLRFRTPIFNQPTVQRLDQPQVDRIKDRYLARYPELREQLKRLLPGFLSAEAGAPEDDYIPDDEDTRSTAERQIRIRRGQPKFRLQQLRRFQSRCAITGCQVIDLLEAAHISPYRGDKDNAECNGLLLRTDIHTLFDLNLLTIDPKNHRIVLARSIRGVTDYGQFDGQRLVLPRGVKLALTAIEAKYKAFIRAEKDRAC